MTSLRLTRRHALFAASTLLAEAGVLEALLKLGYSPRSAAALLGTAQAASSLAPVTNPVVDVLYTAKLDCEFLNRPDDIAVGIVGNPSMTLSAVYPDIGLQAHFGDRLAAIEKSVALCIVPTNKGSTLTGNHDFTIQAKDVSDVGWLSPFINHSVDSLMPLDFAVQATADQSQAIIDKGGALLPSYHLLDDAIAALASRADALGAVPSAAATMEAKLTALTRGAKTINAKLAAINAAVGVLPAQLAAIKAVADSETDLLTYSADRTMTYLNDALMWHNNPLRHQFEVASALFDAGVASASTLALGHTDVNGGGDFTRAGGSNTNGVALSAVEAHVMLAQFAAAFFAKYPGGVLIARGDGGRSGNGGDSDVGPTILMAGRDKLASGIVNKDIYASVTGFAQAGNVTLSDGTSTTPTQANLAATAAKLAGYTYGTHAYVKDIVLK